MLVQAGARKVSLFRCSRHRAEEFTPVQKQAVTKWHKLCFNGDSRSPVWHRGGCLPHAAPYGIDWMAVMAMA